MASVSSNPFTALESAEFIVLTTFRASGEGVPTTVWFAVAGEKLYITTGREAGKAKRLRRTPEVLIAPSDARGHTQGEAFAARGRVLAIDAPENEVARQALERKYAEQVQRLHMPFPFQTADEQRAYLEVVIGE